MIPTPRPRSRTYSSASRDSRPQLDIHQRQRRLFALKRRNGERRLCPTWIAYRTGFDRLPHVLGFDVKGHLVGASSLFDGNELRPVFHLHPGHKPKSDYVSSGVICDRSSRSSTTGDVRFTPESGLLADHVGTSALCRFCCRSPLQAFLVGDSVAVMRFATGAGR